MDADGLIVLYDLDPEPALASVPLADCQLHFHRQRATRDVWCIAVGPLGTLIFPIVGHDLLEHVRASGQTTSRPRGRTVAGLRIDIDENVAIVLHACGQRLDGNYVFADGSPFGAMLSFGYDSANVETTVPKSRP